MSIKLGTLELENFNSFLGCHKVDFVEKQGNIVLIKGIDKLDQSSNGTGKSTIVDALSFSFFGRSMKKEINLDDLVNKKSEDPLKTVLTFNDSTDGVIKTRFRIERIRSKYPQFSKCSLYIDDKCVSDNLTNTEVQTRIESIIGMDYQMFINNNVLNPELFKFIKGNNSQKLETLERVLNLNVISKMFFVLSRIEKEDEEIYDEASREHYALETSLKELAKQDEEVNKNIKESITSVEKNIKENEEKIELLRSEFTQLCKEHEEAEKIVDEINESISKKEIVQRNLDYKIKELRKKIKYYEKNESCHACGQPIKDREKILSDSKAELETEEVEIKKLDKELEDLNNNPSFKKYEELVEKRQSCLNKINNKEFAISQDKKTIEKLSSITSDPVQIQEAKSKLEKATKELSSNKEKYEITSFWRNLLIPKSKCRTGIASDLLKVLNFNIHKYVRNFYNKDVSLSFSIEESNINENILIDGEKFKYDQLSSGEKQKIDIVIVLSLLDIAMTFFKNNRLKFLLVDEALDHLDQVAINRALELIKQYAIKLNMMVLLISHSAAADESSSLFDDMIVVEKDLDGNSTIA